MNARWAVLVVFYLLLGLLGAWYLSGTTSVGADLATYQRAGEALYTTGNPYAANVGVPEDYVYRYPPLLAMVIPVLGWPPLWFALIGFATVVPMVVGYRVSGPAGLLPVALLVGAWGQQLLNGNVQAFVVALLAIVPLTRGAGAVGLALATMLKIHPVLAIVWYAGRREWRLLGIYGVAMLLLTLIQLPWIPDMIDFYLADPVATETIPGMSLRALGSRAVDHRDRGGRGRRVRLRPHPLRLASGDALPARRAAAHPARQPGAAAGGAAASSGGAGDDRTTPASTVSHTGMSGKTISSHGNGVSQRGRVRSTGSMETRVPDR